MPPVHIQVVLRKVTEVTTCPLFSCLASCFRCFKQLKGLESMLNMLQERSWLLTNSLDGYGYGDLGIHTAHLFLRSFWNCACTFEAVVCWPSLPYEFKNCCYNASRCSSCFRFYHASHRLSEKIYGSKLRTWRPLEWGLSILPIDDILLFLFLLFLGTHKFRQVCLSQSYCAILCTSRGCDSLCQIRSCYWLMVWTSCVCINYYV